MIEPRVTPSVAVLEEIFKDEIIKLAVSVNRKTMGANPSPLSNFFFFFWWKINDSFNKNDKRFSEKILHTFVLFGHFKVYFPFLKGEGKYRSEKKEKKQTHLLTSQQFPVKESYCYQRLQIKFTFK